MNLFHVTMEILSGNGSVGYQNRPQLYTTFEEADTAAYAFAKISAREHNGTFKMHGQRYKAMTSSAQITYEAREIKS